MSPFNFNPDPRDFPLLENNTPVHTHPNKRIEWRLWRLNLFYVYSDGKSKVLDGLKDIKVSRRSYSQFVSAKCEQNIIDFHKSGLFRDLKWVRIDHDRTHEKPIDGWLEYDYIMNLDRGTENQWTVIK